MTFCTLASIIGIGVIWYIWEYLAAIFWFALFMSAAY